MSKRSADDLIDDVLNDLKGKGQIFKVEDISTGPSLAMSFGAEFKLKLNSAGIISGDRKVSKTGKHGMSRHRHSGSSKDRKEGKTSSMQPSGSDSKAGNVELKTFPSVSALSMDEYLRLKGHRSASNVYVETAKAQSSCPVALSSTIPEKQTSKTEHEPLNFVPRNIKLQETKRPSKLVKQSEQLPTSIPDDPSTSALDESKECEAPNNAKQSIETCSPALAALQSYKTAGQKKITIGLKTALSQMPQSGSDSQFQSCNGVEEGEIPSEHSSPSHSVSTDESHHIADDVDGEVSSDESLPAVNDNEACTSVVSTLAAPSGDKQHKVKQAKSSSSNTKEDSRPKRSRKSRSKSRTRDSLRPHRSSRRHSKSPTQRSSHSRRRSRSRSSRNRKSDRSSHKSYSTSRGSDRRREHSSSRRRSTERPWRRYDNENRRRRSRSRSNSAECIDKERLYEIARRNVSAMLQAGTLQHIHNMSAAEIAKLKAGGQSVEQLVEYCKKIAKKQSQVQADGSDVEQTLADEDEDFTTIHHPFALKPFTGPLVLNIPGSVPLPTKTPSERAKDEAVLRLTFPVSSGQQHRTKESALKKLHKVEWTPVTESLSLGLEAPVIPAMLPPPPPPASPKPSSDSIGDIIGQRIKAIKRLQQNPNDSEAIKAVQSSETQMSNWAESKVVPGAFTGSTNVVPLSVQELGPINSRHQAWARRDQLTSSKPVQSGMGMYLLQKMGWRPGEGLGKNNTGTTVPLMLDIKADRKGLVALEEIPTSVRRPTVPLVKDLAGKHPVSALSELCSKRKWGPPSFNCHDVVQGHFKQYLWTVVVNGVEYQPSRPVTNKKTAKAEAAQVALQSLGLVPRDMNLPVIL